MSLLLLGFEAGALCQLHLPTESRQTQPDKMLNIFHNPVLNFLKLALVLLFTLFLGACAPEIGDTCERSTNCPAGAICDTTTPDGYCTINQCTPGGCPDESICVEFGQRTSFCMKWCESDDQCRSGHQCVREEGQNVGYCYAKS